MVILCPTMNEGQAPIRHKDEDIWCGWLGKTERTSLKVKNPASQSYSRGGLHSDSVRQPEVGDKV